MSKSADLINYSPDFKNIEKLIDDGLVNKIQHPENKELTLYNYRKSAQCTKKWSKDLMICRGLVVRDKEIIARPFPKFFNHFEFSSAYNNILKGPWEAFEKMDGSLGILYKFAEEDYRICTRGSFSGAQAQWATQLIKSNPRYRNFKPREGLTYLFEIIYPENRVVVDYGNLADIFLLEVIETSTGKRVSVDTNEHPFKFTKPLFIANFLEEVAQKPEAKNAEGYILIKDNFRIKFKFKEYMRLHAIMSDCTTIAIWRCLKQGIPLTQILERVPDEFYDWVVEKETEIRGNYNAIINNLKETVQCIPTRCVEEGPKAVWQYLMDNSADPALCMNLYRGKELPNNLWDRVKPEMEKPFL